MTIKQYAGKSALAAWILFASAAHAHVPASAEYYPFADTDMVSAGNLNTKTMGAGAGAMTPDQAREILMYLKAGS